MKIKLLIILLGFLAVPFICYAEKKIDIQSDKNREIFFKCRTVSLIQLISRPEKYNGKFIAVIGFVNLEFEGDAVYLSEEDYRHGIGKNAVRLLINEDIEKNAKKFDNKYCHIAGTFKDTSSLGNDVFSGMITDIKFFQFWGEEKKY
ncbi:MAG: hypothetical protein PHE58_06610 [Candidatus Omnitrophica bacterium]|nr:hypothetical protein [Candidatus Omnitrophota bacterium]